MYSKMCTAIQEAVNSVVPTCKRKQGVKRKVSDKTKQLYARRAQLRGQGTQEQYKKVQDEIKASSLADFEH